MNRALSSAARYKFAATLLALALALPARADDCADEDELCLLSEEVIRLDADLAIADARNVALTRTLAACEARTCPPPPEASVWPVVAAGAAGVALGLVLAVLAQ